MSLLPPAEENQRPWLEEHDSCALIANVRKAGRPTHGNVKRTLAALGRMGHRTGEVDVDADDGGVDGLAVNGERFRSLDGDQTVERGARSGEGEEAGGK